MERRMKMIAALALLTLCPLAGRADLLTGVPGAADQGGMLMPMVSIRNADDNDNPTSGEIAIDFDPAEVPVLRSLQDWSPDSWFAETAAKDPSGSDLELTLNCRFRNRRYGFSLSVEAALDLEYLTREPPIRCDPRVEFSSLHADRGSRTHLEQAGNVSLSLASISKEEFGCDCPQWRAAPSLHECFRFRSQLLSHHL